MIKLLPRLGLSSGETVFGSLTHPIRTFDKRIWLVLIGLAVCILAFVQSLNILASKNREQVNQELQKLIGTNATFDGLEVSLWGGLGFSAKGFRIADNPRFAATPLLHATELKLGVSLPQLLLGRVVIDSLTFKNPELQVITDEEGLLNLTGLRFSKKELGVIPKLRMTSPEKKHPAVSFLVTKIRLKNGRVDFFDRSIKEPAEIQIKNIDMDVDGLDAEAKTGFRLAAALTEGLRHDVKIEGQLGPIQHDGGWSQQPVDLEIRFDSLHVPMLARAMPFLRNKIPRELDVTGPMALRAKMAGTFEQPRLTDVTLKVPFFGSSDYNAVLTGAMELSESRAWNEAQVKGKLTLDPVNLTNLRNLPILKQLLPVELATEGSMSVYSQFEGTWEQLRIGALMKADKSELRYRDWLRKPAGSSARLQAKISRQKRGLVLHESELNLGNSTMTLSGMVEETAESRLKLKLHSHLGSLAPWGHLLSPLSFYGIGGWVNWDITLEKNLAFFDSGWVIRGRLKLDDAELRHKESGRKIDHLNASILFLGSEARVENASFRLGSSRLSMAADVVDFSGPKAIYKLWSAELNPADLPAFPVGKASRIGNLTSSGTVYMQDGALWAQGSLASSEGRLQDTAYRNLRADVAWSPAGMNFKNLTLQTMQGTLRSEGFWLVHGKRSNSFEVASQIDSVDIPTLMSQQFPQVRNRVEGQLNFRGRFSATTQNGRLLRHDLKGSAETGIQRGTIRDFNLISLFFLRGNESPSSKISARLPTNLVALVEQRDTPFDNLKANFTVEQQRIRTHNLSLSTPDYTLTAAGWMAFDGQTKWNGSLVLAPWVTQELQREYRAIRYLLDRQGRLSISFRVEGTFPNIRVRPESRALAQILGWRSPVSGEKDPNSEEKKGWLPGSLEQLLHR
ncbi:MAG TPA: AsmA-like C-terminal region-containing protein [Candidatus Udaeobacter sp.]|nr:AsmA-like C-terminal region-containing protein [Candidatus Udaeobacter sp.]